MFRRVMFGKACCQASAQAIFSLIPSVFSFPAMLNPHNTLVALRNTLVAPHNTLVAPEGGDVEAKPRQRGYFPSLILFLRICAKCVTKLSATCYNTVVGHPTNVI